MHVIIISPTQALAARLPEVLARPDLLIDVIGSTHGQLAESPFINEYKNICERPKDFASTLIAQPELLNNLGEWIIFDDDELMRILATSDLPQSTKIRILPAKTELGLGMLGSKVGQTIAALEAGISTPQTYIARTDLEMQKYAKELCGPFVIKADLGGGGGLVRKFNSPEELESLQDREKFLPGVIQEFISSLPFSVEALFVNGRLAAFILSEMLTCAPTSFGPSDIRKFVDPSNSEIEDSLNKLASVGGLHGFANITFVWCQKRQMHLLIECDMRVNTWVQFGPLLGVPWGVILADWSPTREVVTTNLGDTGRVIHLYPRTIQSGFLAEPRKRLLPWITNASGTWDTRNHIDPAVNAAERRQVSPLGLTRGTVFRPAQKAWNALPINVTGPIERRGLKKIGLRLFGIH